MAVLGAGVAGQACAQRLVAGGATVTIYERGSEPGGHARSSRADGFTFDQGPHVSFTERCEIQDLLAGGIGGQYLEWSAQIQNYWKGRMVRHPAQFHLHGLPADIIEDCIVDLAAASSAPAGEVTDYGAWCERSLGAAFSRHFTFPYTRKYWTVEAADMSIDWVGGRVKRPQLREMVRGALTRRDTNEHYISTFRYPRAGGFDRYLAALASTARIELGAHAERIDAARRTVRFTSGRSVRYERLVSSLPLPILAKMIEGVPDGVTAAADQLLCTSVMLVNVGVERTEGFPAAHWLYVYDEDLPFARVNFPHTLSPANVPAGCGSIQVEMYYSRHRPLSTIDPVDAALSGLRQCGLLQASDRLRHVSAMDVPFANVVFDHHRRSAVERIRAYLDSVDIAVCGRYGEWDYFWSDDSILSGWRAAERSLSAAGDRA